MDDRNAGRPDPEAAAEAAPGPSPAAGPLEASAGLAPSETAPAPAPSGTVSAPAPSEAAEPSAFRPAHAEAASRTFDVAVTRRRPVVFEEDDDLDVPDFLK
jgi:cell division protein FtsZ